MDNESCALFINSCDAYRDILDTFFKLLKKYWPDLPYDIFLSTESLDYSYKGLKITNIHPDNPNCTWTERISDALKKIKSEYIILMLDDFFLYDYVNTKKINETQQWLKCNSNIATFTFWPIYAAMKNSKFEGFGKRLPVSKFKVAAIMGIWNKKQLLKYTEGYKENIWQWEKNATERSNTLFKKDEFYIMINHQDEIVPYDFSKYGLFSGKWLKDTKQVFEKNKIKFNFSKRGFYNEWERPLSPSIIAAFEMESAIIPNYNLRHKGTSYFMYNKKFLPGDFNQEYIIKGSSEIVCWEPAIVWGFGLESLEIKVTYVNKEEEIIDLNNTFGTFARKKDKFIFNQPCPTMYVPTASNKKIYKINFKGKLFLLKDSRLLKETYNESTDYQNPKYADLVRKITLEKLISKEIHHYVKLTPEIELCNNSKVIKKIKEDKIFKYGHFKYSYKIEKSATLIKWSPSIYSGYKIKNMKVIIVKKNGNRENINKKNIQNFPNDGIFLNKVWLKILLPDDAKEIIISGIINYPIKSKELRKVISKGV